MASIVRDNHLLARLRLLALGDHVFLPVPARKWSHLCQSNCAHTGNRGDPLEHTIVEAAHHLGVVITRIWRLQSRDENIFGAKTRIDREKSLEALEEQPGPGEQHQRQRELDDHERIAHAPRTA